MGDSAIWRCPKCGVGARVAQGDVTPICRHCLALLEEPLPAAAPAAPAPDARTAEECLRWLLNRVGSWTNATWQQHLRNEFGDEAANDVIRWLDARRLASPAVRECVAGADIRPGAAVQIAADGKAYPLASPAPRTEAPDARLSGRCVVCQDMALPCFSSHAGRMLAPAPRAEGTDGAVEPPPRGTEIKCLLCAKMRPWAIWQRGTALCHECHDQAARARDDDGLVRAALAAIDEARAALAQAQADLAKEQEAHCQTLQLLTTSGADLAAAEEAKAAAARMLVQADAERDAARRERDEAGKEMRRAAEALHTATGQSALSLGLARVATEKFEQAKAERDAARLALGAAEGRERGLRETLRMLFYTRSPLGDKIEEMLVEWGLDPEWRRVYEALNPYPAPVAAPPPSAGRAEAQAGEIARFAPFAKYPISPEANETGCDVNRCEAKATTIVAFVLRTVGWVARVNFCDTHAALQPLAPRPAGETEGT